jgi:diguanylate cyclase (GGDEF)-like protein
MLELQEKQHKRIVMLSSAALVFAAFATWQLFSGFFAAKTIAPGTAPEPGINVYLISCITLMIAAIVMMMVRSFQDFRQIRVSELFDTATGLPSRTNLLRAAESELQRLQLGEAVALVLVDIRRFKSLNHSFGYQAGDRIIAAVAERLASVKSEAHFLARYDGDRFALLLRQLNSAADVKEIAAGIQRAMVPPFQVAEKSIYIDVSIGSAFIPAADPVQVTELVRRAEFALTEAKAGESNAHVCYSASSVASATRISKMETGLRETLEAEELEINYQPLVDSRFDRIVAVEALARWTHPQLGRVSPADFVALAEELGLTSKMGNGILRRACMQIMPIPDIRLAVNISPRHFLEPGFCEDLKATLAETGMPPERLEIEVTENVLITQDERAAAVIASVRDLGVSVALDDFGTGYSGLSYLNRFDIDRIKIDASFVREIENSISAQSMVATIIHLARDRGLEITVEGVETTGQVVFLSHFGSLWYQGYLFARPMPYLDLLKCGSIAKSTQQSYSAAAMPTKLPLQMPQQPEWSKAAVA